MDEDGVREFLKRDVVRRGSQTAWAKKAGLSAPYLNDVLKGKRAPSGRILKALALVRVVTYRKQSADEMRATVDKLNDL